MLTRRDFSKTVNTKYSRRCHRIRITWL